MKVNLGTIEVAGEKKQALIPYLIGRGVMNEGDKLTNTIVRNAAIVAIEDMFSLAIDEFKLAELEKQIAAEAVTVAVELEAVPVAESTPLALELVEEVIPADSVAETIETIPAEMAAGVEEPKKRRGGRKAKAA